MRIRTLLATLIVPVLTAGSAVAGGPTVVVVDGGSVEWAFLPEGGTPTGYFSIGPDTPPLGSGSALLQTDESADGIALISQELAGTELADFTALSYSTYTSSAPQAPALQFSVDYDNTDASVAWQGRLVFEPANSGLPVMANQWQTWDALAGEWWATGLPGSGVCPISNPCTWAEVLTAFPNAAIHVLTPPTPPTHAQFLVKAGSGWNGTITTYVDAIAATTTTEDIVWDFEATSGQINSSNLGENGWYSDDTRADGTATMPEAVGTNLVSPTKTDAPEGTSGAATVAHDDDIDNQVEFTLFGPPVAPPADEWQGAVHLSIAPGVTAGKTQISHRNDPALTADADGFGFGYTVLNPVFLARYSWMADNLGNPGITGALKLGFITSEFPGPNQSPRTGEDSWDKLLVYEPSNGNGGSADGTWQTETTNFTSGRWWIVDRVGGISTTQGSPMTLSQMVSSPVMIGGRPVSAIWALLTDPDPGEEAVLSSVQFGIGSNNPGGSVYVNQIETSFYRKGMVTTFGRNPDESAVICVPSAFTAECEGVAATIQGALDVEGLGSGDVILVDAGTYVENPVVAVAGVTIVGVNAGASGCGRGGGAESTIEGTLQISASDVVIDGFAFTGVGIKINLTSAVDGPTLRNNRFLGGTEQVIFGAPSSQARIEDNAFDGAGAPATLSGGGQLTMTSSALGLALLRNCFADSPVAAVALVNNATIAPGSGNPAISQNSFEATAMGLDFNAGSVSLAEVSGNVFDGVVGAALRGQLVNSLVVDNIFASGGSDAVHIQENFAGTPPGNSSSGTWVLLNCFFDNAGTGLTFSSTQSAGTIGTNQARFNDFVGNGIGASYAGGETIDVTSNFWGAVDGPSGAGPGTGDPVVGAGLDFTPFATASNTSITPCAVADLAVSIVDDIPPGSFATVGQTVVYTITASNNGPSPATGALVANVPAPGLSACSWTCTGTAGSSCTATGSDIIADVVDIPAGGNVTYASSCTFSPVPFSGAPVFNAASVSAGVQTDTNLANNAAVERTQTLEIFEDGFESGDTSAWSATVP